jgi:ATP-dependent exoDNAse (exonuclease V) alpha subunit
MLTASEILTGVFIPGVVGGILQGAAGTGKTTLTKEVVKEGSGNLEIILVSHTGVAARILSNKSGQPASTICSLIYEHDEEGSFDGYQAFRVKDNRSSSNRLVIVDEASVIHDKPQKNKNLGFGSGSLLKDFFQSFGISTDSHTKVLFIGDANQMPPIGQEFSPALSKEHLQNIYGFKFAPFHLGYVFRQEGLGSDILELSKDFMKKGDI